MANGQKTPQVGEIVTNPSDGKKYRFLGVNADTGKWRLEVVGQSEDQSDAAGFLRTLGQGATFGFSDEAAGVARGIGSAFKGEGFGKGYESGRDKARENLAQFREDHGKTAMLAEGLGGLAMGIGGVGLLRGAGALARGVGGARTARAVKALTPRTSIDIARTARQAELAGGMGKGGGLISKMAQAGKVGAIEGGVYGVGAGGENRDASLGESLLSRAGSGAVGAGFGGLLGGGMGAIGAGFGKGKDFWQGMRAGRMGKGGTGLIEEGAEATSLGTKRRGTVDPDTGEILPDSGPGGLVKTGGSAAEAADDAAAFGLAKLEQSKNPIEFSRKAKAWIAKQESLDPADRSPSYQAYISSEKSEMSAGMFALAEEVLEREAKKGADDVTGLLADRSGRHRATATLASKTTEGPQSALLGDTVTRPQVANEALDQVRPLFGARFGPAGSGRTTETLAAEAKKLAQKNYDAAYSLDDRTRRAIFDDSEYQGLIERMTRAFKGEGQESLETLLENTTKDARQAAVTRARRQGFNSKADALSRSSYTDILGGFSAGGKYIKPRKSSLTHSDAAESVDVFRRTLNELKESLMSGQDRDQALGRELKEFLKEFDEVIDPFAPNYQTARRGYAGRKGILESYQDGTSGSILKEAPDAIRAHIDNLDTELIEVGSKLNPTTNQTEKIMRSELDMFKQGVLDDFITKMDLDDPRNAGVEVAQLTKNFKKLFGGNNPILDPGNADVRAIGRNLDELGKKADLDKKFRDAPDMAANVELEGAVEATAFGYALAGQPGAAARTGLAAQIYGPQRWENVGGALARRLRQGEGQGLLNIADNLAKTEGGRIRALSRRSRAERGLVGLLGGTREETEGQRYRGYRPGDSRRRTAREAFQRYGN
tara:strand:- start:436 stop:3093 length:2658 start_codon:yes stop_codon:yes gene_type:complete